MNSCLLSLVRELLNPLELRIITDFIKDWLPPTGVILIVFILTQKIVSDLIGVSENQVEQDEDNITKTYVRGYKNKRGRYVKGYCRRRNR